MPLGGDSYDATVIGACGGAVATYICEIGRAIGEVAPASRPWNRVAKPMFPYESLRTRQDREGSFCYAVPASSGDMKFWIRTHGFWKESRFERQR